MKNLRQLFASVSIASLMVFGLPQIANAYTTNPTPVCVEGSCTVTFPYGFGGYSWTPPAGISQLYFEVYGAEGGGIGGKGGEVSGYFTAIPSSLIIMVGKAGTAGDAVAGGTNGGGISGVGHGDAGSGGGATDIRTGTSLAERIVVAGGGGGGGGWIGGAGGAGGLTVAAQGGKGATATTGGMGGNLNGGGNYGLGVSTGNGTTGVIGIGGVGGNNTIAGGGGGGGGYFGGGGGGGDNTSGGMDGSGGGGGSSFATMALTTGVQHFAGVRSGSGLAILKYTFAPAVTSFRSLGNALTKNSVTYQLSFNQYSLGLSASDFILTGTAAGCAINSIYGDGYTYQISITGCGAGTLNLTLRAGSITGAMSGPETDLTSADITTFDPTAPTFKLSSPATPTNASTLHFSLVSDEALVTPTASAFNLTGSGCAISSITANSAKEFDVAINGCIDSANVSLRADFTQMQDLAGNFGVGTASVSDLLVDRTAPTISMLSSSGNLGSLIQYAISFSEPITSLNSSAINLVGAGCAISKIDGAGSDYLIWISGCTATPTLTIKSAGVSDFAGNRGPISDTSNSAATIDQLPPGATITEITRDAKSQSPSFEIHFDEVVTGLNINSFTHSGTSRDCQFALIQVIAGRSYNLTSTGCTAGSLQVTLPPNSVIDLAGNAGPNTSVNSNVAMVDLVQATAPIRSAAQANSSQVGVSSQPVVLERTTQPQITKTDESKSETKKFETQSKPTQSVEGMRLESWVSVAIAIVALFISSRRPRRKAHLIRR